MKLDLVHKSWGLFLQHGTPFCVYYNVNVNVDFPFNILHFITKCEKPLTFDHRDWIYQAQ